MERDTAPAPQQAWIPLSAPHGVLSPASLPASDSSPAPLVGSRDQQGFRTSLVSTLHLLSTNPLKVFLLSPLRPPPSSGPRLCLSPTLGLQHLPAWPLPCYLRGCRTFFPCEILGRLSSASQSPPPHRAPHCQGSGPRLLPQPGGLSVLLFLISPTSSQLCTWEPVLLGFTGLSFLISCKQHPQTLSLIISYPSGS